MVPDGPPHRQHRQFLILPFDDPAMLAYVHEFHQAVSTGRVDRQYFWVPGPLEQQPFFRMRFRSPVVGVSGTTRKAAKRDWSFCLALVATSLLPCFRRK